SWFDRSRRRGGTRGGPLPCAGASVDAPVVFVPRPGRIAMLVELIPKKLPARRKPPSFADYRTRPTPRRVATSFSRTVRVAPDELVWFAHALGAPHPVPLPRGARG